MSFPTDRYKQHNPRGVLWRGSLPASCKLNHPLESHRSSLKSSASPRPPLISPSGRALTQRWTWSAGTGGPGTFSTVQEGVLGPVCSAHSAFFSFLSFCPVVVLPHTPAPSPASPPNPNASEFPQNQWLSGAEVREGTAFPILLF